MWAYIDDEDILGISQLSVKEQAWILSNGSKSILGGLSLREIAPKFHKDHTTIKRWIDDTQKRVDQDPEVALRMRKLVDEFQQPKGNSLAVA